MAFKKDNNTVFIFFSEMYCITNVSRVFRMETLTIYNKHLFGSWGARWAVSSVSNTGSDLRNKKQHHRSYTFGILLLYWHTFICQIVKVKRWAKLKQVIQNVFIYLDVHPCTRISYIYYVFPWLIYRNNNTNYQLHIILKVELN